MPGVDVVVVMLGIGECSFQKYCKLGRFRIGQS